MPNKTYSRITSIPKGSASKRLTPGCICLEGGAFRGLYTSGVLDALMIHDINMQTVIGVSAGAMNGMNYAAGQIGRSARINLSYRHDSRYVGAKAMIRNHGVIGFDFVLDQVKEEEPFDEDTFNNPVRRFIAVATSLETGEAAFFEKGKDDIYAGVQASASMQFLTEPVMIDDKPYLDGGVAMSIPFKWALDNNYEKIIVVRTRPGDYRKSVPTGNEALIKTMYSKYPEYMQALSTHHERYNADCDQIKELERQGRILVIEPQGPVEIGRLEPDMEKLGTLYHRGYEDVEYKLSLIKSYLRK